MKSIAEIIVEVCEDSHIPLAQEVFGDPGVEAIFGVMKAVKAIYRYIEPERISGELIVFRVVDNGAPRVNEPPPTALADFEAFSNQAIANLCFEVLPDARIISHDYSSPSIALVAAQSVIYRYRASAEEFIVGDKQKPVRRLDPSAPSQFSVPTLSSLREALRRFATDSIRESTCYIFRDAWFDDNRLFLKAKPERIMRRALTQFLVNRIGGEHEVWPEQNVDESHPVDIQVKPKFSNNRLMIIEIKWLGKSVAEDGHVTATHNEPRAQEGITQLAGYLDLKRQSASGNVVHGYYVIIDARRQNLQQGRESITRADGLFFESRQLTYEPPLHKSRPDFDEPLRMFARSICSD